MTGIALGFLRKRIAGDDLLPVGACAHKEVGFQTKTLLQRILEQAFQFSTRPAIGSKNQVAALQQRLTILETQFGEKRAKVRHADLVMSGEVDCPEKCDVAHHGITVPSFPNRLRFATYCPSCLPACS